MHELVRDTNVLVASLRSRRGASHQLIRLMGTAVFRINVSVALALEYEEVLKRTDIVPGLSAADIEISGLHFSVIESGAFGPGDAPESSRSGR